MQSIPRIANIPLLGCDDDVLGSARGLFESARQRVETARSAGSSEEGLDEGYQVAVMGMRLVETVGEMRGELERLGEEKRQLVGVVAELRGEVVKKDAERVYWEQELVAAREETRQEVLKQENSHWIQQQAAAALQEARHLTSHTPQAESGARSALSLAEASEWSDLLAHHISRLTTHHVASVVSESTRTTPYPPLVLLTSAFFVLYLFFYP